MPPQSAVLLEFKNNSTVLQHNWVLVQAGTENAVATDGIVAGPQNGWIPQNDDRVIAHTPLLNAGETGRVQFTSPPTGSYVFVCTFPGHNFTMLGGFEVTP